MATNRFNYIGFALLLLVLMVTIRCAKTSVESEEQDKTEFKLSDFSSAETCRVCHPNHYDEWSGSMHAYAFVDPINTLWSNQLQNVEGGEELGQFCVQCHSPIGMLTGETPVGFSKENVAPIVKEGINCDACHLMNQASETTNIEATFHYDVKSGARYGSIMDPVANSAHSSERKLFYSQSKACLPCHDLINQSGLPVEITTTEWAQSPYIAMGLECQGCHMATYSGKAAVGGPQRENLHRHDFIGVDIALVDGFPGKSEQLQKIDLLLKNAVSLDVEVTDSVQTNSILQIKATVTNDKTGHDIPSSVTFVRQMWLEVTVTNGADTLYKSGYLDANGDLMDDHSQLKPGGDPDLTLFQSALFKNGEPGNVFSADSIKIGSIAPFESKTSLYSVTVPQNSTGAIDVKVRLRFRTFSPYLIRGAGEDIVDRVPIFEMEEFEDTIVVNR